MTANLNNRRANAASLTAAPVAASRFRVSLSMANYNKPEYFGSPSVFPAAVPEIPKLNLSDICAAAYADMLQGIDMLQVGVDKNGMPELVHFSPEDFYTDSAQKFNVDASASAAHHGVSHSAKPE